MGIRFDAHDDQWRLKRDLRDPVDGRGGDLAVLGLTREHVQSVRYHPKSRLLRLCVHVFSPRSAVNETHVSVVAWFKCIAMVAAPTLVPPHRLDLKGFARRGR